MSQTHNLFKLSSYLDSQEDFINHIVPELTQLDRKINLNNIRQFDELLTYFETSFKTNSEVLDNSSVLYVNLVLPSYNVIRILMTLASLIPDSNWTSTATDIDGIPATTEYINGLNDNYYHALGKPPLKDRSVWILKQYGSIICRESHEDSVVQLLYSRVMVGLSDFMVHSRLVPSKRTQINRKPIHNSPVRQHRITSFFQSSPTKDPNEDVWKDDEVSDSETELTLINSHSTMENELKKYQDSPPARNFILDGDRQVSGLQSSFALFDSVKRNGPETEKEQESAPKKAKVLTEAYDGPIHRWENLRIFGHELLGKRLNPELNSRFSLWLLMNWTFFCADQSSKYQRTHINTSSTAYHLIYTTYNELFQVLYDLIAFNFTHTLRNLLQLRRTACTDDLVLLFFASSRYTRLEVLNHMESADFLIHLLLTQLDPKPIHWYDRLVEYVLNGLGQQSQLAPVSCYDHERHLIRADRTPRERFTLPIDWKPLDYNDNYESMLIRYRIITLVYYRLLFFTNGAVIGYELTSSSPHLSSLTLIRELVLKFSVIDFVYLREFYSCLADEQKHFPRFYEQTLLVELAGVLFLDITKTVEFEHLSLDRSPLVRSSDENDGEVIEIEDISWQRRNLDNILLAIGDRDTYLSIIEDETYQDYYRFEQVWLKATFLLEFLLDIALEDYSHTSIDINYVQAGYKKCQNADVVRAGVFCKGARKFEHRSSNHSTYVDIFCNRYYDEINRK